MRLLIFMLAVVGICSAAEPVRRTVDLNSEMIGVLGMPLAESTTPIYRVRLSATVDEQGEGDGFIDLDPTGLPAFDEFGFPGATEVIPVIKLECKFKRLKRTVKTYVSRRLGAPENEAVEHKEDWRLYSITGPKISTRLYLATVESRQWLDGRFLVKGDDDKVKYVVNLQEPPQPEPCHPGCFPAGTLIRVPGGKKAIEEIGPGDRVITVTIDGVFGQATVADSARMITSSIAA